MLNNSKFDIIPNVSNPIREYLQITRLATKQLVTILCFKPYKGVSSNFSYVFTVY